MDLSRGSDNIKELIAKSLEVEINKRTTISLYDRFGPDKCICRTQNYQTLQSIRRFNELQRRRRITTGFDDLNDRLVSKRGELRTLTSLKRGRQVDELLDLNDRTRELRDELQSDLDLLAEDTRESDDAQGQEEEKGPWAEAIDGKINQATIDQWRLDTLPRASTRL